MSPSCVVACVVHLPIWCVYVCVFTVIWFVLWSKINFFSEKTFHLDDFKNN